MNWSKFGSIASIASFALSALLAVIQYWAQIINSISFYSSLPVILLVLGVVFAIFSHFKHSYEKPSSDFITQSYIENWGKLEKIIVRNRIFINERVVLDGFSYIDCKFQNVTFVYKGEAPYDLTHNTIIGSYHLSIENPSVSGVIGILKALNYLPTETPLLDEEKKSVSHIESARIIEPFDQQEPSKKRSEQI